MEEVQQPLIPPSVGSTSSLPHFGFELEGALHPPVPFPSEDAEPIDCRCQTDRMHMLPISLMKKL